MKVKDRFLAEYDDWETTRHTGSVTEAITENRKLRKQVEEMGILIDNLIEWVPDHIAVEARSIKGGIKNERGK